MRMKKILTLVCMLVAFCGVSMADDTYTIVGNLDIFGNWDKASTAGDMELVSGTTYSKSFKAVRFTQTTNVEFKILKNHDYSGEGYGSWPSNNYTHSFDAGVYDITISFDSSTESITFSDAARLYLVYSNDSYNNHTVGEMMALENGVHSVSFDATEGYCFLIVPSYALDANQTSISKWENVICPQSTNWYDIYIQHMSGAVSTSNNEKKWYIKEPATYTLTYSGSTFTVDAQTTVSIGPAGWATYSTGDYTGSNGYTITGASAFYVSGTADDKAQFTPIAEGAVIPTKAGVIVKGSSFTVNTTSETGSLSGNLLVGSGSNSVTVPSTGYILANGDDGLGFYSIDDTDNALAAHKAYLNVADGARSFIAFDNEATSIQSIAAQQENGEIYNLSGQRVAQPQKGLYIVGGKKVMMK